MRWMEIKTTQHFSICKWACVRNLRVSDFLRLLLFCDLRWLLFFVLSVHSLLSSTSCVCVFCSNRVFFAFELVCVLTFRLTAASKIDKKERKRDTDRLARAMWTRTMSVFFFIISHFYRRGVCVCVFLFHLQTYNVIFFSYSSSFSFFLSSFLDVFSPMQWQPVVFAHGWQWQYRSFMSNRIPQREPIA